MCVQVGRILITVTQEVHSEGKPSTFFKQSIEAGYMRYTGFKVKIKSGKQSNKQINNKRGMLLFANER